MKKILLFLALFLFCLPSLWAQEAKWNISKSTHFIVHYKNAPEDFIDDLIENSERYYDAIADTLGFRRYDFWLWEKRANIYIYDDAKDYQAGTGQPAWSGGCANGRKKEIITYPYAKDFLETILPHEMSHIIFREFVGFDNYAVPLWLDEGVASYQESMKRQYAAHVVKEAIKQGTFIEFDRLSSVNPRSLGTKQVGIFYAESLTIIDFLIKEYGSDSFVTFCQNLRDKQDLSASIRSTYSFNNIGEMGQAWEKFMEK